MVGLKMERKKSNLFKKKLLVMMSDDEDEAAASSGKVTCFTIKITVLLVSIIETKQLLVTEICLMELNA